MKSHARLLLNGLILTVGLLVMPSRSADADSAYAINRQVMRR
jgi:hypothetical protein